MTLLQLGISPIIDSAAKGSELFSKGKIKGTGAYIGKNISDG
jgi:hypothetical protein